MWSHYADRYAGAVVEFDVAHEFFAHPIDVEYRARRPRRHIDDYLAGVPIPVSELCTKSDQWAYEQEVRIIRRLVDCENTGKVDLRGFPIYTQTLPIVKKSVMLGERMAVEVQREIFAIVMDTQHRARSRRHRYFWVRVPARENKNACPYQQNGTVDVTSHSPYISRLEEHEG